MADEIPLDAGSGFVAAQPLRKYGPGGVDLGPADRNGNLLTPAGQPARSGLIGNSGWPGLTPGQNGYPAKPDQGEIISHLGSGLSVRDATWLNDLNGPQHPNTQNGINQIADAFKQARDTLMTPANGGAGEQAYSRFVAWATPALQNGFPVANLLSDNRLQQFAPTVDDYRKAAITGAARSWMQNVGTLGGLWPLPRDTGSNEPIAEGSGGEAATATGPDVAPGANGAILEGPNGTITGSDIAPPEPDIPNG